MPVDFFCRDSSSWSTLPLSDIMMNKQDYQIAVSSEHVKLLLDELTSTHSWQLVRTASVFSSKGDPASGSPSSSLS